MLRKKFVFASDLDGLSDKVRSSFVVAVTTQEDFSVASEFFSSNEKGIKAVQVCNSLLADTDVSSFDFNYYSVVVDDVSTLKPALMQVKGEGVFVELVISALDVKDFLSDFVRVQRLIAVVSNDDSLTAVEGLFSDLMERRLFPLTYGVPFCCGKKENVMHIAELYGFTCLIGPFAGIAGGGSREGCMFGPHCFCDGTCFTIRSADDVSQFTDVLAFLNEYDEGGRL